jgi:oligosaccharyl transferase complex subunit OST4
MISDSQLYSLALFLGGASMILIVLYHFLEVNAKDEEPSKADGSSAGKAKARVA